MGLLKQPIIPDQVNITSLATFSLITMLFSPNVRKCNSTHVHETNFKILLHCVENEEFGGEPQEWDAHKGKGRKRRENEKRCQGKQQRKCLKRKGKGRKKRQVGGLTRFRNAGR